MQSQTQELQSRYNSYSYKFIVITLAAKLVFFLKATCSLLLVVANVTIGKTNERFSTISLVVSDIMRTFANELATLKRIARKGVLNCT